MSYGRYGCLNQRQPLISSAYVYASDLGRHLAAYAAVWPDVVVVMRNISDSSLFMPRAGLKRLANSPLRRSCLLVLQKRFRMWMSRMWMDLRPFSV